MCCTILKAQVTDAHSPGQVQGIALSSDPSYKVLGAAYPWVARRLLTDSNPELRETLRVLLYKGNRFQFSRLESLLRQAMKSPARVSRARTAPGMAGSANAPTPDPAPQRGGPRLLLPLLYTSDHGRSEAARVDAATVEMLGPCAHAHDVAPRCCGWYLPAELCKTQVAGPWTSCLARRAAMCARSSRTSWPRASMRLGGSRRTLQFRTLACG